MKTKIRVFPDYCSSGLWEHPHGANLDESDVEHVVPKVIMIALKYWHRTWEGSEEYWTDHVDSKAVQRYVEQWQQDGKDIVQAMNECQDEFEFIYVEGTF